MDLNGASLSPSVLRLGEERKALNLDFGWPQHLSCFTLGSMAWRIARACLSLQPGKFLVVASFFLRLLDEKGGRQALSEDLGGPLDTKCSGQSTLASAEGLGEVLFYLVVLKRSAGVLCCGCYQATKCEKQPF